MFYTIDADFFLIENYNFVNYWSGDKCSSLILIDIKYEIIKRAAVDN